MNKYKKNKHIQICFINKLKQQTNKYGHAAKFVTEIAKVVTNS